MGARPHVTLLDRIQVLFALHASSHREEPPGGIPPLLHEGWGVDWKFFLPSIPPLLPWAISTIKWGIGLGLTHVTSMYRVIMSARDSASNPSLVAGLLRGLG